MDPRKLKVNELKEQLQLVGLSANGKKEELLARLLEHQKAEEDAVIAGGPPTGTGEAFEWDESKFDVDDFAPPSSDTSASAPVAPTKTTTSVPVATPATDAAPSSATESAISATASSSGAATTASNIGSVQFQGTVNDAETLKAEHEKRKNRAARFGIPLKEQDKAVERAARFGVPVTAAATASLAKATGTAVKPAATTASPKGLPNKPGTISVQVPADVLNKRRERFGITEPVAASATSSGSTGAGAAKAAVAVDPVEEEKKRKRALKFGLTPAADDASKKQKL